MDMYDSLQCGHVLVTGDENTVTSFVFTKYRSECVQWPCLFLYENSHLVYLSVAADFRSLF